jgi:hypothetical protein
MQGTAEPEREPDYCDSDHPTVPVPDRRLYATWQTFPLHRAEHGLDGTLRVLQDSRFTGPGADRSGTHPVLKPCDALPGRIEVLDASGQPVHASEESPQIDVTAHSFAPGQTLYQVKSLVRCLASCWCGHHVSFMRVLDAHIVPLTTRRASGKLAPVRGVTRGCFESGGVGMDEDGHPEVRIHRTRLIIPDALSVDERHWWDGEAWQGSAVERKIRW